MKEHYLFTCGIWKPLTCKLTRIPFIGQHMKKLCIRWLHGLEVQYHMNGSNLIKTLAHCWEGCDHTLVTVNSVVDGFSICMWLGQDQCKITCYLQLLTQEQDPPCAEEQKTCVLHIWPASVCRDLEPTLCFPGISPCVSPAGCSWT